MSKLNYVVGFFDGTRLGFNFSYWDCADNDFACASKVQESFNSTAKIYVYNATNDQIADGLDKFCSDYRNRRIKVADAIWLVTNGIAGRPQAELDKMIESWRKNANAN